VEYVTAARTNIVTTIKAFEGRIVDTIMFTTLVCHPASMAIIMNTLIAYTQEAKT